MKKFIICIFIISAIVGLHAQVFGGAIATTDFTSGLTITLPDGSTPVPDGFICQIMLPGIDGVIDAPNSDGTPGGDDLLVSGNPGNAYYEFLWDSSWTGIVGQLYTPASWTWMNAGQGVEPTANAGDNFYLRVFDATTVAGALNYLNSALYILPATDGDLFLNTTAHWDYSENFNWQSIAGSGPTDPFAPSLVAPTSSNTTPLPIDVLLEWEEGTSRDAAEGYRVYLDTDAGFANAGTGEDVGLVTSWCPFDEGVTLDFNTVYNWKVVAYNSARTKEVVVPAKLSRSSRSNNSRTSSLRRDNSDSRGDSPESNVWQFLTDDGDSEQGSGTNPSAGADLYLDIPPVLYNGGAIDPDCNFNPPDGATINFTVDVSGVNNNGDPLGSLLLSYNLSYTGLAMTINVTLGFSGYGGNQPDEIRYWNGSGWVPIADGGATNIVLGADFVSFDWPFTGAGREIIEFAVNDGEGTLPVTLTNFNYTILDNEDISINWSTASEVNVSNFEIYRGYSEEISEASFIGEITPTGSTSSGADYSFVDENTQAHTQYYYWLTSIDLDLTEDTFGPISVFYEGEGEGDTPGLEFETRLIRNTPNPFNPTTTIEFSLAEDQHTSINIYNTKGQLVKKLVDDFTPAGEYQLKWNGKDDNGKDCSTGVFYYRMKTENFNDMRKMLLLK